MDEASGIERQSMEVDIVCVGFGPATGGFLTTLSRAVQDPANQDALMSRVMPGLPLQVVCYERADDIGFGVSGVVTKAQGIRASFPDLDPDEIPMARAVTTERLVYLKDPIGASRRSAGVKGLDALTAALKPLGKGRDHAVELRAVPEFMSKEGGLLLSIGQFNQWVGSLLMATGHFQIWPGTPVAQPLIEGERVVGVRLVDQGTDRSGAPEAGFMPGMDVKAALTVLGDGPVGPVGRKLDERFGLPGGNRRRDWAVGMKMVVDLPEDCPLEPGTVLHTIGYPEPEIFGFLYVYGGGVASLGIFVPSWLDSPVRTSYRYLQHWMTHPYLWRYLEGGRLRSWGAKTLQESGRRGEPHLVGHGYARIGEGSGSTNVLTGSGVDEAWTTGVQLAEGVIELLREQREFSRENLEASYVRRRRASWVEREARVAEKARDGFRRGFVTGLLGMGLAGVSKGRLNLSVADDSSSGGVPSLEEYYAEKISAGAIQRIRAQAESAGTSLHDALMEAAGWPPIAYDGRLLLSHQDALLVGGKVQAPPGFADHVAFIYPSVCEACDNKLCVEICSGEAITPGVAGLPQFDREKCVHCGACIWNCESENIDFRAGAGGLHSAEN